MIYKLCRRCKKPITHPATYCSNWNVDKVTKHTNFNYGVTSKVTAPQWKN